MQYTVHAFAPSRFDIRTPRNLVWYDQNDEVATFCDYDDAQRACDNLNDPRVDWNTVKIEDIDRRDYPHFCDAFISYAETYDGTPLEDEQLEKLNRDSGREIQSMIFDILAQLNTP